MIGADIAAEAVAERLRQALPAHLAALRELHAGSEIPDPRLVAAMELAEIGAEKWPAVLVAPEAIVLHQEQSRDRMARRQFLVRYRIAIEGYVRARTYEATAALNRRYAAAVRSVLVQQPSLGVNGQSYPRVGVNSVSEEYAPVFEVSRGRTVGSFRTTFELDCLEVPLIPAQVARVASVEVEQVAVGPTEPLPEE